MHVIGKGKSNVLQISVILADLEINLEEFSGAKQSRVPAGTYKYACEPIHKNKTQLSNDLPF